MRFSESNLLHLAQMTAKQTSILGGVLLAAFATLVNAEAGPTAPETVQVANQTRIFTQRDLQNFLLSQQAALAAHLANDKYALWIKADVASVGEGQTYCHAAVGLTRLNEEGRNERVPAEYFTAFAKWADVPGGSYTRALNECHGRAIAKAVGTLAQHDWTKLTAAAERATAESGPRSKLPENAKKYSMFHQGRFLKDAKLDSAIPAGFTQAFDYRQLQFYVMSDVLELDKEAICYAAVGITAPPPDGLNPRFPGNYHTNLVSTPLTRDPASRAARIEKCETSAIELTLGYLLRESWDQDGLLQPLAKSREDGVPLVKAAKKASRPK